MYELKEFILRRIRHAEKRISQIKESYGDNPSQTHNYHGGWDLGYWEGLLAAYENVIDEIDGI
jgi:hypothetical protein